MKTSLPGPLRRILTLLAIITACGLSLSSAHATGYVVTLQQVGSNVVATGSGAFDLTGLTFTGSTVVTDSLMAPQDALLVMGPPPPGPADSYSGITGPTNFGSGGHTNPSSGSGDKVSVFNFGPFHVITVPAGYVSGHSLFSSDTYTNQTFSSLGVTPGTYVWSWGPGANQNFTLIAGAPDSGSAFVLLLLSLAGLFAVNRLRSLRVA